MNKKVAVYLGSAPGNDPKYKALACETGRSLAANGFTIIYGGACVGTMGAFADGALKAGGKVVGVFPKGFEGKREVKESGKKVFHEGLSEVVFVKDFSERKIRLEQMSDCAVILPGGFGTMDEMFCYAVGNEIGLHDKQVYVLNADGFYDPLKALLDSMKEKGFLGREFSVFHWASSVGELIAMLLA